ncbi:MAG: hypothetical protein ACRD22_03655, partial [Terriglobia bacterium]
VQLHLFFIAQLHHHALQFLEQESHFSQKGGKTSIAAFPLPEPLDPACQIARQGSVIAASNIRGNHFVLLKQSFQQSPVPRFASATFSLSSGRDPPLFS